MSIYIIIATLFRKVFLYKISKQIFIYFWTFLSIRLLLPFPIKYKYSIHTLLDLLKYQNNSNTNIVMLRTSINSILQISDGRYRWLIYFIWLSISLGLFTLVAIMYVKSIKVFRLSQSVNNQFVDNWKKQHHLHRNYSIRLAQVKSPLTYGTLHPIILLPVNFDFNDKTHIELVLLHEFTHIKKFHSLLKLIILIVLCINWFNPFVWIMYKYVNNDMEMACDQFVVQEIGIERKKEYAKFLLAIHSSSGRKNILHNYFCKDAVEERLTAIVKTKRKVFNASSSLLAISFFIVCFFLTDSAYLKMEADKPCIMKTDDEVTSTAYVPPREIVKLNGGISRPHLISSGVTAVYESDAGDLDFDCYTTVIIELSVSKNEVLQGWPSGVIGYCLNGKEYELYAGTLKDKKIEFVTNQEGHYSFYLINACSESINVHGIKILKGGDNHFETI